MNCLGNFLEQTHERRDEEEMNCRPEFRGLCWKLGNPRQSAIGFLQVTSRVERNFLVGLAQGEMDSILENPDHLHQLENISPILHEAYSGLTISEERLFQDLIGYIFEVYQDCFRHGRQWWEETCEDLECMDHEQYIASGRKKVRLLPNYTGWKKADEKHCSKTPYNENNMCGTFFLSCVHGYFLVSLLMHVVTVVFLYKIVLGIGGSCCSSSFSSS